MGGERAIELLELEMDLLWGPDLYGRPRRSHPLAAVAVAVTDGEQSIRFGPDAPQEIVRSFTHGTGPTSDTNDEIPAVVPFLHEQLASLGPIQDQGCLSYVFEAVRSPLDASSHRVVTSEDGDIPSLTRARPERWWEREEWDDLLAGRFGPWATGVVDHRVVSVCHTPIASPRAAEAGIWTHPDERGRGWASDVTHAWATIAQSQFETLFYSTSFGNLASRSVALKLSLRSIGAIWQLFRASP